MKEQMLDMSALRVDGDTQPRTAIIPGIVQEYAEAIEAGADFPPVQVVHDGATHWLVDGFHRFYAHRRLKRSRIKADVVAGELKDARWRSVSANKAHGLRRTNDDKAKAVRKALKLRPELSDRAIAEHVGVHHSMVSRYRATSEPTGVKRQLDKRIGMDGRRRQAPTARRRRKRGGISRKAFKPVRTGRRPLPMTALDMPHDPVMGARTLIGLFDADYLRALTTFLTQHLKGADA